MSKEKEEVDYGTLGFEVDDTALPLKEVPKEEEKPARGKPKSLTGSEKYRREW